MNEFAPCIALGIAGVGLGYFIPRSRNVITRLERIAPVASEGEDEGGAVPFEEIFAAIPLAVLILSPQNLITQANGAAGELFGRRPEQMRGRAVVEATGSSELDQLVHEVPESGELTRVVEYNSARLEATLRVSAQRLRDRAIALIALDETALVNAERVRREFLANVSHELRSPLAGTKLMIETLQADHQELQTREYFLPRLSREIDRMIELVEHLLELARSESGRIRLKKEPVALKRLIDENLDLLEGRILERDLRLERELAEVTLEADPARLAQVVLNFVENAMRHTPAGGVITVRLAVVDGEVLLSVADTGSGVPYRDLPHLFERFYVVDRSRAKDRGGLGVGLAIVKRNIEAHGGRVEVVSEFGHGSTFSAYLPLGAEPTLRLD